MEADLQLYEEIFKPNKKGKSGFFELKGMKFVYESGYHTAFQRVPELLGIQDEGRDTYGDA